MGEFAKNHIIGNLEWYLVSETTYQHNRTRISELLQTPEVKEYLSLVKGSDNLRDTATCALEDLWNSVGKQKTVLTFDGEVYFIDQDKVTHVQKVLF